MTLFLAVTSAASAELVAVSSIIVYDIYKPYFAPTASEKQVLFVSHCAVFGYGIFMMVLGIVFAKIGISLSWLYGCVGYLPRALYGLGVWIGVLIRTPLLL